MKCVGGGWRLRVSWALALLLCGIAAGQRPETALSAKDRTPSNALTVERIYGEPTLGGHPFSGVLWSPDSRQVSFFKEIPAQVSAKAARELWAIDSTSGEAQRIIPKEKLQSVLAEPRASSQATGLGRRTPPAYLWAPRGDALLFQGPTYLTWFDLKTQTSHALVSGNDAIADARKQHAVGVGG